MASLLSPAHILRTQWPLSFSPRFLGFSLSYEYLKLVFVWRRQWTRFPNFLCTVVLTCVTAAWLVKRTFAFLANSHLLPSLALACAEQSSEKKVLCCWQKFRVLFTQIFEKSPFRVFTQGLLIRGIMMIPDPTFNLLTKVLKFRYGKDDPFCPSVDSLFHSPRHSFCFGADLMKQHSLS